VKKYCFFFAFATKMVVVKTRDAYFYYYKYYMISKRLNKNIIYCELSYVLSLIDNWYFGMFHDSGLFFYCFLFFFLFSVFAFYFLLFMFVVYLIKAGLFHDAQEFLFVHLTITIQIGLVEHFSQFFVVQLFAQFFSNAFQIFK